MEKTDEKNLLDRLMQEGGVKEPEPVHIDDILQQKLEKAFHKHTSTVSVHDIAKITLEYSPIDLAYAVSHLPPNARPVLFDNLPDREAQIKFLINTSKDTRLRIFRYMSDQEMKKIFEKMPTDEAVWMLDDMSERRYRRVLELLDAKKAHRIRELKKHNRNSAGRLMTGEFFAFYMDMTVGEAAAYIRDYPRIDFTLGIYVLNEKRELIGYVPGRNIIINPPNVPLRQIMRPVLHKVAPEATREEVVDLVERYKISSLPVVDALSRIIGVVAYEDVLDAMEDLADEAFAQIAGTAEKEFSTEPTFKRFLARMPWLIVTLLAGLLNFAIMYNFEHSAGPALVFVIFFVPLITGMSGNIGIQCSTVLVRTMAVANLSHKGRREAAYRELMVGLATGSFFGVGCGFLVYFFGLFFGDMSGFSPAALGLIVGCGLLGAGYTGTFLGVYSPVFFTKIGIDPAISSGPIVTALNDILSMSIYLLIAWSLITVFFSC